MDGRLLHLVRRLGIARSAAALGLAVAVAAPAAALAAPAPAAAGGIDAGLIFRSRCSGCHSVGKGDVVGPDLKGVTSRHDRKWLLAFIPSSQTLIQAGDPSAVALYAKYGRKTMPDHPLSQAQVAALLAFIEAGGPAAGEGRVRLASAATPAEVALGRDLFLGRRALASSGAACALCHVAGPDAAARAGTLGPDLSRIFFKFEDWGLTRLLTRCEEPLMAALYGQHPLTAREIFALKAFLYRTALAAARQPRVALAAAAGGR